jgi:hypothetical protein
MMPPIPNITPNGLTMTMRVENGIAADSRTVFVMPVVISLTGDMFVNWRADVAPNPNPNPIAALQPVSFAYRLQSGINIPASFDLTADIINASAPVPAGLVNSIEFRDANNAVISNRQVEMGKSDTRNIIVRIPQIPAAFASQNFTLKVTAFSGKVTGTEQRTFTVGAQVPQIDTKIEVIQLLPQIFDQIGNFEVEASNGRLEGSTIKLKTGRQMIIPFNVKLTQNGIYQVTIQPKPGTTMQGWGPQLVDTLATVQVPQNNDQTVRLMQIAVTASTSTPPTPTGTLIFRIKRDNAAVEWFKEFGVELLQ